MAVLTGLQIGGVTALILGLIMLIIGLIFALRRQMWGWGVFAAGLVLAIIGVVLFLWKRKVTITAGADIAPSNSATSLDSMML